MTIPATAHAQGCNSNDPKAPCFANVQDILNGRKTLFPDDDLVFNTTRFQAAGVVNGFPVTTVAPSGANLLTSNSNITQTSVTGVSNKKNDSLSNVLTFQGQLFNIGSTFKHRQILSAAWVQNAFSKQKSGVATLEGSDSSITVPSLSVLDNAQQLYGTSDDFLGNGADQMVVAGVN